ncbi:MAG: ACP S-malonyltransferase [Gammaproteobacteria bacterium]|jgi:[acyl-carrier-protein] S-malonyltransferase|nr:ACP S-malonyltransferase [Gammaproteobacteria bacterium]
MVKLAYVFPGQGSQAVGMLEDVGQAAGDLFAEASSILGYDLWGLIASGPEEKLNQTEFTQPALLTSSVALYQLAIAQGAPEPSVVAGHSLGEYSALVAAGVLQFADAVSLVQKRGQFMQSAVPVGEGSMAAILGLSDEKVQQACADAASGDVVQAANFNAPNQVVIAGTTDAVKRAIEACKSAGAKRAMQLPVSAPFHSALMQPAAARMAEVLEEVRFSTPTIPVVQNIDASVHADADEIRENLVSQMCGAVLWTDTVLTLVDLGVDTAIECGPGKVLTGLARRIDKSIAGHNILSRQSIGDVIEEIGA